MKAGIRFFFFFFFLPAILLRILAEAGQSLGRWLTASTPRWVGYSGHSPLNTSAAGPVMNTWFVASSH